MKKELELIMNRLYKSIYSKDHVTESLIVLNDLSDILKNFTNDIVGVVSEVFQVRKKYIFSINRKREYVQCRQVIMWYDMKYNNVKPATAAKRFRQKRCNAIYIKGHIDDLYFTDLEFRLKINEVVELMQKINE